MKFLVTSGRRKGFSFEVTDSPARIGRSPDNEVMLDDESISGRHAKICSEGDQVVVEDCESINGIEVNGKLVKKATDSRSPIQYIPYDKAYEEGFEDMPRRVPDIAKARRMIGWKPKLGIHDILRDVIEYQRAGIPV